MKIVTGTYVGNGDAKEIATPFRPLVVLIKGSGQFAAIWSRLYWSARGNRFGANDSFALGVTETETGFAVGTSLHTNADGVTYHYIALADDGQAGIDLEAWQGNGLNGLNIVQTVQKLAAFIFAKRDNGGSGIIRHKNSNYGARMDGAGGAANAYISAMTVGGFTLTNAAQVNQFDGPGQIGEGTTAFILYEDAQSKLITWTGTGAPQALPSTGFASIKGAIIWADSPTFGGRIKLDTMGASEIANLTNGALVSDELSFSGGDLVLGSATTLNATGVVYNAMVFGPDSGIDVPRINRTPVVRAGSGRKVVSLTGVASRIECGTDDSIALPGARTTEALVRLFYNPGTTGPEGMIMSRVGGPLITPGNVSWAMGIKWWTAIGWESQFFTSVTDMIDLRDAPDCGAVHRTAATPLLAWRWVHLIETVDGAGKVKLYINGKCVHQRDIDMVAYNGRPNGGVGGTNQRMTMFATWDGSTYTNPVEGALAFGRKYSRAITPTEAFARYQRGAVGASVADVTSGLVEEWDAVNASGTSMPATFNPANSGTIVGGSVITL